MKKKLIPFLIAFAAIFLFFVATPHSADAATSSANDEPIFFIPGAYDNDESWQKMAQTLDPNNEHALTKMFVSANGKVLRQDIRSGNSDQRPFVIVLFQSNAYHESVITQDANGLNEAINTYAQKNPFTEADLVAQSNGGTISTTYLEKNAYKSNFNYHFNHLITIGTPYNFQAINGADNTIFLNRLILASDKLPKDLQVTNVIGANGTDTTTDGVVSRDSALSGKKIFDGKVASFKQLFITGEDASHGNQESSPQFAKIVESILNL